METSVEHANNLKTLIAILMKIRIWKKIVQKKSKNALNRTKKHIKNTDVL